MNIANAVSGLLRAGRRLSAKIRLLKPPLKLAAKKAAKLQGGPKAGGRGIAISSGHGLLIPGARGLLDEVREARRIVSAIAGLLREKGVPVSVFHDDESATQAANLDAIVGWHNRQKRGLDVSIHLNAFLPTEGPMGTETLYRTAGKAAKRLSKAVSRAGGFRNRGAKKRGNLAFLNRTKKPALLLETCFVDSAADVGLYKANFDAICRAIAEELTRTE